MSVGSQFQISFEMKLRFTFFKELSSSLKKAALEALRFRRELPYVLLDVGRGDVKKNCFPAPRLQDVAPGARNSFNLYFSTKIFYSVFSALIPLEMPPRLFFFSFFGGPGGGVFPNYSSFQTRKSQK